MYNSSLFLSFLTGLFQRPSLSSSCDSCQMELISMTIRIICSVTHYTAQVCSEPSLKPHFSAGDGLYHSSTVTIVDLPAPA